MPPKYYGLRDVVDIFFIDKETGEKIEVQALNASVNYSENPSEPVYLKGTEVTNVSMGGEFTLQLEDAEFTSYGMAVMFGLENKEQVKKLLRIEKKTTKRRIRNKVRKKIRTLLFTLTMEAK